jgi:hypothetical protein
VPKLAITLPPRPGVVNIRCTLMTDDSRRLSGRVETPFSRDAIDERRHPALRKLAGSRGHRRVLARPSELEMPNVLHGARRSTFARPHSRSARKPAIASCVTAPNTARVRRGRLGPRERNLYRSPGRGFAPRRSRRSARSFPRGHPNPGSPAWLTRGDIATCRFVRGGCSPASSTADAGLPLAPPGFGECGVLASSFALHPRPSR